MAGEYQAIPLALAMWAAHFGGIHEDASHECGVVTGPQGGVHIDVRAPSGSAVFQEVIVVARSRVG